MLNFECGPGPRAHSPTSEPRLQDDETRSSTMELFNETSWQRGPYRYYDFEECSHGSCRKPLSLAMAFTPKALPGNGNARGATFAGTRVPTGQLR